MPLVTGAADKAAKGLRHFCADDPIIKINSAIFQTAGAVQYVGARPRNLLHDNQPQRMARNVHPVAQCIGSKQASMRIIAENIDECPSVYGVDMLGIERQAITRQAVRDTGIS